VPDLLDQQSEAVVKLFFAYYLPQFHPVQINDLAWGEGFSEWSSVLKMHRGLRSPSECLLTPAELGFYDLRQQDTRQRQQELATRSGLDAFCVYHYYSDGERPMSTVVEMMKFDGTPSHPFFFCWANHDWTKAWIDRHEEVTFQQKYTDPLQDKHFDYLVEFFKDDRYVKIGNRPLFMVYEPLALPSMREFGNHWNSRARSAGYDGVYFIGANKLNSSDNPSQLGLEGWVESAYPALKMIPQSRKILSSFRPSQLLRTAFFGDFSVSGQQLLDAYRGVRTTAPKATIPSVMCSWNGTGRRPRKAWYLTRAGADWFENALREAVDSSVPIPISTTGRSLQSVAINAWNEWGEGMALEPSVQFGHALLDACKKVRVSLT
jgi:hypothetical protein